jgi:hypothetical protein
MDREASQILGWVLFAFRVLVLFGALGAVLGLVRSASSRAAYLLAAAIGLQLATMCCWRAAYFALRGEYGDTYRYVIVANNCAGMLLDVVTYGLVAYAFVLLARALGAPPASPPASPSAPSS